MAQAALKQTEYSRDDYFAFEEQAAQKSEFDSGQILAMAGGSRNHSVICFNLNRRVGEAIDRKECVGFDSNMKVEIQRGKQVFYPDMMVVCGDIEFAKNRTDAVTNPLLIVEVLSPATEAFDRSKKFAAYRTLPSLREYVLVAQDEPQIEAFYKEDDKTWRYTVVRGLDETIRLLSLDCELALAEIYQKVVWNAPQMRANENQ